MALIFGAIPIITTVSALQIFTTILRIERTKPKKVMGSETITKIKVFGIKTNTKRRRLGQSKVPVWGVPNQCQTNLFMKILILKGIRPEI